MNQFAETSSGGICQYGSGTAHVVHARALLRLNFAIEDRIEGPRAVSFASLQRACASSCLDGPTLAPRDIRALRRNPHSTGAIGERSPLRYTLRSTAKREGAMRKVLFIFSVLTDGDVEWLARAGERMQLEPGTVLIPLGARVEKRLLRPRWAASRSRPSPATPSPCSSPARSSGRCRSWTPRRRRSRPRPVAQTTLLRLPDALVHEKLGLGPRLRLALLTARLCVFLADRMRHTTQRMGYGSAHRDGRRARRAERRPARQTSTLAGGALSSACCGDWRADVAGDESIFRKAALDRLASPERLDERLGLPAYPAPPPGKPRGPAPPRGPPSPHG